MELDPDARRLLDLTREARTPSARDRARVDRALAGALVLSGASSAHAATGAAAKAGAGALALKVAAGAAAVVVATSLGYLGWRSAARTGADTPEPARAAAVAPAGPRPVSTTAEVGAAPPESAAPAPAEEPARRSAAPPPRRTDPGTLPTELDLLHEAQAKWRRGDAAGALAVLAEHRRRFPRSQLAPERDALSVLSLCATNRTAEARRIARRFLRTAPRSPLRASVEESCGGG